MPRSDAPLPGVAFGLNRASIQAQSLRLWYPTLNAGGPALHDYTGRYPPAIAAATAPTRYTDSTVLKAFGYVAASTQWIDTGFALPQAAYNPVTVMAWVRRTVSAGAAFVVCIVAQDHDTLGRTFDMSIQGTGLAAVADSLMVEVGNGANTAFINDTVASPLNTWFHAAWSFDGTNHRLYKNGVQVATATTATMPVPPSSTTTFTIGRRNYTGFESYWTGQIADVRVYSRALPAAVIAHCAASATRWDLYAVKPRRIMHIADIVPPNTQQEWGLRHPSYAWVRG